MEWGDVTPLRTKIIRLDEGDLFVSVVNAHGLQTDNATSYSMEVLRPSGIALASMQAKMDAVCLFQNWCGGRGIDFLQRLESGEFFTQQEEASLREALREDRRKSSNQSKKRKKSARPVVGNAHWRNRCAEVRDYVAWFAEAVFKRARPDNARLPEMRARLASFREKIVDGIRIPSTGMTLGLRKEQVPVFVAAITPGDPTNPFASRNHVRNHALWLTYHDGGLRLGEALGLKTIDCILNGGAKRLMVHRRPDDPEEPRKNAPLAKTLPHLVDIEERLASVLHDFIVNHRPSYPGARRSPYVFLSEDGGPLSKAAVAYMYRLLREEVEELPPGFCTNDVRRSWNNRFALGAKQAGLSDERSAVLANHAQGRVPHSEQAENYRGLYNQEQTAEIMNRMQDAIVGTAVKESE
jgi:integrase